MNNQDIIREIIKEQSLIIGEQLAKQMARDSGVVRFNSSKIEDISVTAPDSVNTVDKLIHSYENLFGKASVEVCLNVIRKIPGVNVHQFLSGSA